MLIHAIGAVLALLLVIYAARAWAARGFPISMGHSPHANDDGSFWILLIGLFLLGYCCAVVGLIGDRCA